MISQTAIEEFRNQKLESYLWMKKLSIGDINKQLGMDLDIRFKTKPYQHQAVGLLAGLYNEKFLYFLDMGLGKTKIILDILDCDVLWKRALVLSPNASTVSTWSDEIGIHSNFPSTELMGTTGDRWETMLNLVQEGTGGLVLLNYTGLLVMLTNNLNGKWVIDHKKLNQFRSFFDAIIFDEIHLAKNPSSLTFKICREIGKTIRLRYGLTGTPINRDPLALWSQFYLIDGGETLGKHISLFREAYFKAKPNFWGGVDYKFDKKYEDTLNIRLTNKSLRYSEKEALDLPEMTFTKIPVVLSEEQAKYYEALRNSELVNIQNTFIKLRQISSGFLPIDEEILFKENPKLEELISLINSTPEEAKLIVFLDFIRSGDIICDRLKKEGIKFERLYGGTKDKSGTKNRFIDDPKCKVFVSNIISGGTGLNLQVANYCVFYELPYSNIQYTQALKRIHRIGQDKKVFIYSLVIKNSVEAKIEKYLKEGKDIFKAVIEGKEKL